ncbi:MAG: DUF3450 family protein [Deltaproteobacteria bacterium]|nr:DUF3450 family protein [Deltaproteobacteria bacterium]
MLALALLLAAQAHTGTPTAPSASASTTPGPIAAAADAADATIAALGATLASLRAEVDAAAADVAQSRRAADDDLAALDRRRRELEARLAQSELTARELQARDAALTTATQDAQAAADAARAPVLAVLQSLRVHVDRVPFRVHGRRERIDAVAAAAATLGPDDAAALVWPIIVDEARLLAEVGRVRQPIDVGGAPLIAEVAHVGPLVFWKSKDDRTGVAVSGDRGAQFVSVDDVEARQRLLLFFDALRRGAARGAFVVPHPLAHAHDGAKP